MKSPRGSKNKPKRTLNLYNTDLYNANLTAIQSRIHLMTLPVSPTYFLASSFLLFPNFLTPPAFFALAADLRLLDNSERFTFVQTQPSSASLQHIQRIFFPVPLVEAIYASPST